MRTRLFAALMTTLAIGQLPVAAQGGPPHPPPGKMIDVGGYRVHLHCVGVGNPVVMIVGAGNSFDWSLVQPAVSGFARVCAYDPSGSVWSDPGPPPDCDGRVIEIHKMLANAGIDGPLVLVGHSIGAVFARLYAGRYPAEVRGMVLIDHAGRYRFVMPPRAPGQPGPPIGMPLGDDSAKNLPAVAWDMHRWASARSAAGAGSNIPFFNTCIEEVANNPPAVPGREMPLIVIANKALADSPDYRSTQAGLLALSHNSKPMVASTSGHQVPMDDPAVVIDAIRQVVAAVRNQARLQ